MLDRDLEVVEVVFLEQAGFPDGALDEGFGRRATVFLQKSRIERPGIDADTEADTGGLGRRRNIADLVVEGLDVAGVHANGGAARVDCLEDVLRLEVDIGDDGDLALFRNDVKNVGVVLRGDSDSNDVATGGGQFRNLLECAVDVGCLGRRHRLNRDLRLTTDHHLAHLDLAGLAPRGKRLDDAGKSDVYSHTDIVLR